MASDRFSAVVTAVYNNKTRADGSVFTAVYFKSDAAELANEDRIVAYYNQGDPMIDYLVKGTQVEIYQEESKNGKLYWQASFTGEMPAPSQNAQPKANPIAVQALTAEQKVSAIRSYIEAFTGLYPDVYKAAAQMAHDLNADLAADDMDQFAMDAEAVRTVTTGMMIQIDRQFRLG